MTLPILITPEAGLPIYLQIKHQIRYLVASHQLQEGSPLPSVRNLAAQLGVNANTVAQAYRELIGDGLIVTRQGRGTFVNTFSALPDDTAYVRLRLLSDVLHFAVERGLSLGFSGQDLRHHLTAALAQPARMHLMMVGPTSATAEKYRQLLSAKLGEEGFSVTAASLSAVEAGSEEVLDAFKLAYFAITFPLIARPLERALEAHQLQAEVVSITAELTRQSRAGLRELAAQRVFLVTEDRNVATALNIVLQHSALTPENITSLVPSPTLQRRLLESDDLIIYTFGVRDALDALGVPASRRYELTFDVSEDALHALRRRLGVRGVPR